MRLAREHGIVTPYTAYLILEDEAERNVPIAMRSFRELETDVLARDRARGVYESAELGDRLEKAGTQAVENSVAVNRMKFGYSEQQVQSDIALNKALPAQAAVSGAPATQPAGYKVRTNYSQQVRLVNGKTFYQNGVTWNDAQTQAKQNLRRQEIKFNSDDYFALLRKSPEVAQWLSLGEEVDLVIDDTLYVVR